MCVVCRFCVGDLRSVRVRGVACVCVCVLYVRACACVLYVRAWVRMRALRKDESVACARVRHACTRVRAELSNETGFNELVMTHIASWQLVFRSLDLSY